MSLREFELSPNDADRFSAELRKEFPTVRFLLSDFTEHWMERTFSDKPTPGFGPNYREIIDEKMRPPHGEPMPYAQSLRDLPHDRLTVWLEPPGWKPQWSAKPYRRGRYVLLNEPEHHFVYFPAQYGIDKPSGESKVANEPFTDLADGQICGLYGGFMYGPYFTGDTAQIAFLKRAWRIARKVTTNKLVRVDGDSLQSLSSPVPGSLRVGFDALEWTRRDRRHLIGTPVQYFFRAADAFPADA
jgi:hypothetical protein